MTDKLMRFRLNRRMLRTGSKISSDDEDSFEDDSIVVDDEPKERLQLKVRANQLELNDGPNDVIVIMNSMLNFCIRYLERIRQANKNFER